MYVVHHHRTTIYQGLIPHRKSKLKKPQVEPLWAWPRTDESFKSESSLSLRPDPSLRSALFRSVGADLGPNCLHRSSPDD